MGAKASFASIASAASIGSIVSIGSIAFFASIGPRRGNGFQVLGIGIGYWVLGFRFWVLGIDEKGARERRKIAGNKGIGIFDEKTQPRVAFLTQTIINLYLHVPRMMNS